MQKFVAAGIPVVDGRFARYVHEGIEDTIVMVGHARDHKSFSHMWVVLHLGMVYVVCMENGRSAVQVHQSLPDGMVDRLMRRMNNWSSSSLATIVVGVASVFVSLVDGGSGGHIGKGGEGAHRSFVQGLSVVRVLLVVCRWCRFCEGQEVQKDAMPRGERRSMSTRTPFLTNDERAFFVTCFISRIFTVLVPGTVTGKLSLFVVLFPLVVLVFSLRKCYSQYG
jgi:hypothetical protein